jgi:hypothetical protein
VLGWLVVKASDAGGYPLDVFLNRGSRYRKGEDFRDEIEPPQADYAGPLRRHFLSGNGRQVAMTSIVLLGAAGASGDSLCRVPFVNSLTP